MANGTTTNTSDTTNTSGSISYDNYINTLRKSVASTKDVTGTKDTGASAGVLSGLSGSYKDLGQMAVENYQTQVATKKKEAEKAATGLEMAGEATIGYLSNLEALQGQVKQQAASTKEAFSAASEKADEYVQAAKGRVSEVLSKLDEINSQIAKDRDFSKAHAMQAAVQSSLGSMKAEERNILETYGTDSKEYQQFQQSKQMTLATIQSNIHATYQQLAEEQGKTYLTLTEDAYTKSNMYLGYQEQQHVDMLKYKADAEAAYDLQVAQFQTGVEQLKMTGQENLANWIIETPSFSMDATPLITLLADLQQTQMTNEREAALSESQASLTGAQAEQQQVWNEYMKTGRKPYQSTGSGAKTSRKGGEGSMRK